MEGLSGTGQAQDVLRVAASYCPVGGEFTISISTSEIRVARYLFVTTLGALYTGYRIFQPLIDGAVKRALGGDRDDQGDPDIGTGCLIVRLCCYTDKRFIEFLEDYEHGRLKDRLGKEFYDIGLRIQDTNVKILNIEDVNKTKEVILERYV